MSRRALGIVAVLAAIALAAWLGFSDGREHKRVDGNEAGAAR